MDSGVLGWTITHQTRSPDPLWWLVHPRQTWAEAPGGERGIWTINSPNQEPWSSVMTSSSPPDMSSAPVGERGYELLTHQTRSPDPLWWLVHPRQTWAEAPGRRRWGKPSPWSPGSGWGQRCLRKVGLFLMNISYFYVQLFTSIIIFCDSPFKSSVMCTGRSDLPTLGTYASSHCSFPIYF
jgi:hypothetical protein